MNPQDIPYIICGSICLLPLLAGLTGFLVPFLFAKRLPYLLIRRWREKSRKHFSMELSLESRESLKAMRRKGKAE